MSDFAHHQIHGLHAANAQTTQWTDIAKARADDDTVRQKAIDALAERYWKPVYCT